jgi:hypothetical protein
MDTIFKSLKGITLILLLSAFFVLPAQSQVTIGTLNAPLKGTLLDLKQQPETSGTANSTLGMKFSRVALSSLTSLAPLLSATDEAAADKLQYKGVVVYNVTANATLQQGLYMWDGANWVMLLDQIVAGNGLTYANDSVKLGGALNQNTVIDLAGQNLLFRRSTNTGKIGIGTIAPGAPLEILPASGEDPLILDNLQLSSSTPNSVDAANPALTYYDLQVSDGGVVRKAPVVNSTSDTYIYTLSANTPIAGTNSATGSGGSNLVWSKKVGGNATTFNSITLPQDGAYVFAFRFYGNFSPTVIPTNQTNAGQLPTNPGTTIWAVNYSFYLSAWINGAATPADIIEMIVTRTN